MTPQVFFEALWPLALLFPLVLAAALLVQGLWPVALPLVSLGALPALGPALVPEPGGVVRAEIPWLFLGSSKRVEGDRLGGKMSGVEGIPALLVNGARYGGSLEPEALLASVERAASGKDGLDPGKRARDRGGVGAGAVDTARGSAATPIFWRRSAPRGVT